MTELKMCPFCGEQIYYEVPKGSMDFDGHCWNKNCFMYGIEITFGDIAKYNTRPIEDELNAQIAQLEAENDRLASLLHDINSQLEIATDLGDKRWKALNEIYTNGEKHNADWSRRKAREGLGIKHA